LDHTRRTFTPSRRGRRLTVADPPDPFAFTGAADADTPESIVYAYPTTSATPEAGGKIVN
jgi:hypothetical protein